MAKKVLLIVVLILAGFLLVSCQTVSGIGGDIQWLGDKTAEVSPPFAFGVREDDLTPLYFLDGKLVGWGRSFAF